MFLPILFSLLTSWFVQNPSLKVATKWNDQKKEIEQISIVVGVASFNSGLSSRDSHMLEVLDALTYPRIIFSSSSVQYTADGIVVKGKMQFHGVERMIETKVKMEKVNNKWVFTGKLPILLEDYKVERPSLLFVKVDNLVQIDFKVVYNN
jgi:polyisoprenoid-binding protein YceI